MTDRLDFAAIKHGVKLDSLLRHYRVELRPCGKNQYRGRCPIHRGEGFDAFHVNLSRNIFHCFACGAGGTVLDFVVAMEGCSLRDAAITLQSMTAATESAPGKKKLVTEKRCAPEPLGFVLRGIDTKNPYLATRGIDQRTAAHFGVGFYSGPGLLSHRLVIPIHDAQGTLVGYCGRSINGQQPRYRFPPSFPKSDLLFNFHRAAATEASSVVVVEGFFDCLKVHQAGIRSVVALMGAALYKTPARLLLDRFPEVVLMLDGDNAGKAGSRSIAKNLGGLCSVSVVDMPAKLQPDQMSSDMIRNLLHSALPEHPSAR
ncbi:MAG: CHC2 zinc finger domain-containing protein [Gemmatimonadaceae bacterium]